MNDKVVVLNAEKTNFDGNVDFSSLTPHTTVYDDTQPGGIPPEDSRV